LIFELMPRGDVFGDAGDAIDFSVAVFDGKSEIVNPSLAAVGPDDSIFHIVVAGDLLVLPCGVSHTLTIFGVNRFQPGFRCGIKTLARASPNVFVGWTDIDDASRRNVGEPENFLDAFGDLPE